MKRGHAEALMPLLARVMKQSGIAFAALDRVAATTGPGSFTGLRVGLSAARGIALAASKPVVGITTLSAYAAPHVSEHGEHPIISAIDARHDPAVAKPRPFYLRAPDAKPPADQLPRTAATQAT